MKDLEHFEDVTIDKNNKHLTLFLNGKIIKNQINLVIENKVDEMTTITVTFRVPNENIEFVEKNELPLYYPV